MGYSHRARASFIIQYLGVSSSSESSSIHWLNLCDITHRVRSLGETDLNPVSAIGKISQLIFAVVQPGNIVANLVAGGLSEAGAAQAGDLMQDLKTGDLSVFSLSRCRCEY